MKTFENSVILGGEIQMYSDRKRKEKESKLKEFDPSTLTAAQLEEILSDCEVSVAVASRDILALVSAVRSAKELRQHVAFAEKKAEVDRVALELELTFRKGLLAANELAYMSETNPKRPLTKQARNDYFELMTTARSALDHAHSLRSAYERIS